MYGWLLLTPAAILLIAFTHYPTIATFIDSFFSKSSAIRPSRFIGVGNYEAMFEDPIFWKVLFNNLWFALGTIPTSVAIAIVMALLVNRSLPGQGFLRMAYFTPTILPMIAVANIWLFFYTPEIGLIDQILQGLGLSGHNWLGDPDTVLGAVIVMTVWKEAGVLYDLLSSSSPASPKRTRRSSKIGRCLSMVFLLASYLPFVDANNSFCFDQRGFEFLQTCRSSFCSDQGGPDNASNLLLYYIYENAFSYFDPNYASTLTVVLLALLAILALLQFFLLDRRIHYR